VGLRSGSGKLIKGFLTTNRIAHEPPTMIYARNKDIITGKVAYEWQCFPL
jgi:hypothetical protein